MDPNIIIASEKWNPTKERNVGERAIITVGEIQPGDVVGTVANPRYNLFDIAEKTYKYKPMSWNEFATLGGYNDVGKLPTVSDHWHTLPKTAPTGTLLERISRLNWRNGGLTGTVIGGGISGYNAVEDMVSGDSALDRMYGNQTQY